MFTSTRRRALAMLGAGTLLLKPILARAVETEQQRCIERREFGPWKATATNGAAGAQINEVHLSSATACHLLVDIQINTEFAGMIFIYGDIDAVDDLPELSKAVVTNPDNRFIVRTADGATAIDEPLCGVCTNIEDDSFTMVLPIAMGPLLQSGDKLDLVFRLNDSECSFAVDAEELRQALHWSAKQRLDFEAKAGTGQCEPVAGGCFLTTACCGAIGLPDDCFELKTLRRYRDGVLALTSEGRREIALYYDIAPLLLARLPHEAASERLTACYARFILPCALATKAGLGGLAHRLYRRMMRELVRELAPEHSARF
jgi:hypothetical protein